MYKKDFLKIYVALTIFHLVVLFKGETDQMLWLSKPLIIASLLIFTVSKIREGVLGVKLLAFALAFSLFGDVALMLTGENAFLIGMGFFTLTHLFYIFWYFKNGILWRLLPIVLVLVVSSAALWLLLQMTILPNNLEWAIYTYFVIITLHLGFSVMSTISWKIKMGPVIGIVLFIFSDWWIAWDKFGDALQPAWINPVIIMFTYALSQALIILSLIQEKIRPDQHQI
jgi:uncharacterized membrane protein YhhN